MLVGSSSHRPRKTVPPSRRPCPLQSSQLRGEAGRQMLNEAQRELLSISRMLPPLEKQCVTPPSPRGLVPVLVLAQMLDPLRVIACCPPPPPREGPCGSTPPLL